jgi:ATP-binding cassette subfamily F protein 3
MLTVHSLSKTYNLQTLFENVSFSLNPGERKGLVGPNGCGKTTLVRILAGLEPPTNGHISRDPHLRIGYLPQGFDPDPRLTLGQVIDRHTGNNPAFEDKLAQVAESLTHHPANSALQVQYDDILRRIQFNQAGHAGRILAGLGLDQADPQLPVDKLSGGEQTRLSLALVLLEDPQLLLLDEPTNHLDISMLEWLEQWLTSYSCAALVISHDRAFLDNTVSHILDMDPLKHRVREFTGNYSAYLAQRESEIEHQWSAYHDQQAEIRRIRMDIIRTREQSKQTERKASSIRIGGEEMKQKGAKDYQQHIAKKVARKAKSRQKKLERYLESDELVEKPQDMRLLKLEFEPSDHLGRSVMRLDKLSIGFLPNQPLISAIELELRAGQRIALSGPNGCGKTTLLRTMLGKIPALAGEVHMSSTAQLGYMAQDQAGLQPDQTAVQMMLAYYPNETEARSFLAKFLFTGDEPLKPISLLSYGQRTRLLLARLVAEGSNCLLLDEPINHLDIPSRLQFEQALSQFDGAVLAVVHDRYFIQRFADEIWWVQDGDIQRVWELPGVTSGRA